MNRFIVVGGSGGIGRAVVERLLGDGHRVALMSKNATAHVPDGAARLAQIPCDIDVEADREAGVSSALGFLGGVDGVVLNAANMASEFLGRDSNVVDMSPGVWQETFATNVFAHAEILTRVIPAMVEGGGGSVVFMSSDSGKLPDSERPAYGASKAALNSLMRHVASRWGRAAVRANAVSPGTILTPALQRNISEEYLRKLGDSVLSPRLGRPEDVANVVAFLLSEESAYINAQVIHVNGGRKGL